MTIRSDTSHRFGPIMLQIRVITSYEICGFLLRGAREWTVKPLRLEILDILK
jgi:hypothetical protein